MALNLIYPLKKGTYRRVRGFASHVKHNPGTWYGIDDGCKVGTPLIASESGRISHSFKRSTGGGWSFILNFTKYPGWSMWYAHCSSIPGNTKLFKKGQVIGKSGATGGVSGPHLHYSIFHKEGGYLVPKDPDSKSVVKWGQVTDMIDKKYLKDKLFKYKGSPTIYWHIPSLEAFKKYISPTTAGVKTIPVPNKSTLANYVKSSNRSKADIKRLQKDLKEAVATIGKQSVLSTDLEQEVLILKDKLKARQETPKTSTEPKKGGGNGMLEGKKTYIVAAVLILSAIGQYLTGDLTLSAAITLVLGALGLGALRRGIETK